MDAASYGQMNLIEGFTRAALLAQPEDLTHFVAECLGELVEQRGRSDAADVVDVICDFEKEKEMKFLRSMETAAGAGPPGRPGPELQVLKQSVRSRNTGTQTRPKTSKVKAPVAFAAAFGRSRKPQEKPEWVNVNKLPQNPRVLWADSVRARPVVTRKIGNYADKSSSSDKSIVGLSQLPELPMFTFAMHTVE